MCNLSSTLHILSQGKTSFLMILGKESKFLLYGIFIPYNVLKMNNVCIYYVHFILSLFPQREASWCLQDPMQSQHLSFFILCLHCFLFFQPVHSHTVLLLVLSIQIIFCLDKWGSSKCFSWYLCFDQNVLHRKPGWQKMEIKLTIKSP